MTVIWQLDNKDYNKRLIKKKDQNNYFWAFAVPFAIECELTPQSNICL